MRSWFLFLFLAACGDRDAPPAEWTREYEGHLPRTDRGRVAVLLVRDAETGAPIAGARVRRHLEAWPAGDTWAPLLDEALTDEYGLAWFVVDDPVDCHWAVDADGYAPTQEYGGRPHEEVELRRGADRTGRFVDAFGEPVAGVRVEYKVGCAHSPALRTAVSDGDGVFVLRCIDAEVGGEVTYAGPGVLADYWSGPTPRAPGAPLATEHVLPARAVRGRVLDGTGVPVNDAAVFSRTSSRGPLARVGRDGRFVLHGADPGSGFTIYFGRSTEDVAFAYRPGGPFVHRVRAPDDDATVPVTVVAPGAVRGRVHIDRVSDGRRFTVDCDDGRAEAEVFPGRYEISLGGPFDRLVAPPVEATLPADGPVRLAPVAQPRLVVDASRAPDGDAKLVLADRFRWIDLQAPMPAFVAADARAVVRVAAQGIVRSFAVGPARDGKRRVTIDWPRPRRIRILHRDGFVGARLERGTLFGDDAPGIESSEETLYLTHATGRQRLFLSCAAGEAVVPVDLDRDEIVLRDLVFAKPRPEPSADPPPGPCAIRVEMGAPDPVVYVDGRIRDVEVDGLAVGPHTVIVGATGRVGRVWRVVLEDGETRVLRAKLRAR